MNNMLQKILINKLTLNLNFDRSIFENISWSYTSFHSHQEIATILKNKNPYTITVLLESLEYKYWNKKEYVKKTKIPISNKYKELLYNYFLDDYGENKGNEIYASWINKYKPLHKKEQKYESVDEYIIKYELESRYKTKIFSRFKNRQNLFKNRVRVERDRFYNLPAPLNWVDWRTPYDNLFVWEENGQKVAQRGGSGSSGTRETNSLFIFGLLQLNKSKPIPSYLFLYSKENTLLFIKKFDRFCVPAYDLGANYHLDSSETDKIKKQGMFIWWNDLNEVKEVTIGKYRDYLKSFRFR